MKQVREVGIVALPITVCCLFIFREGRLLTMFRDKYSLELLLPDDVSTVNDVSLLSSQPTGWWHQQDKTCSTRLSIGWDSSIILVVVWRGICRLVWRDVLSVSSLVRTAYLPSLSIVDSNNCSCINVASADFRSSKYQGSSAESCVFSLQEFPLDKGQGGRVWRDRGRGSMIKRTDM